MGPIKAMHATLALFSAVPVPPLAEIDRPTARASVRALPWLGMLFGLVMAGIVAFNVVLRLPNYLVAIVCLAVLAGLTGSLHLDGVADVADGLGSRKGAEDALAIMKKSDIGPMGVISLLFVLLLQIACLTLLTDHLQPPAALTMGISLLIGGPMVGRLAVLWATRPAFSSARPGGFGELVIGVTSLADFFINAFLVTILLGAICWAHPLGGLLVVVAVMIALVWAAFWGRRLARRFGGFTGDCFGSLIETTQLAFWLVGVVLLRLSYLGEIIQ